MTHKLSDKDIEKLGINTAKEYRKKHLDSSGDAPFAFADGFITGFKAAQEQLFSEEDIRQIVMKVAYDVRHNGFGFCSVASHYSTVWMGGNEEFLKSLKQSSLTTKNKSEH